MKKRSIVAHCSLVVVVFSTNSVKEVFKPLFPFGNITGKGMPDMNLKNFLKDSPKNATEEIVENILSGKRFRLERIISKGQASPEGFWYDQDQSEWVLVLKGRAGLMFEDLSDILEMNPGDYLHIPAHRRHRVAWTDTAQETIWLAIHYE